MDELKRKIEAARKASRQPQSTSELGSDFVQDINSPFGDSSDRRDEPTLTQTDFDIEAFKFDRPPRGNTGKGGKTAKN